MSERRADSHLTGVLAAQASIARAVGRAARASGHGGTSLPGKLMLRFDGDSLRRLAAGLPEGCVLLSATNGKTTTAAFAASILSAAGIPAVHNVSGANMSGGIASALLERRPDARIGLFEVDEFWLPEVAAALEPRAILLGNLFRDQLDRYGELETIGQRWAQMVAAHPAATLVLNADDPLIADLGRDAPGSVYFGIEDRSAAVGDQLAHASDSTHCANCGEAYAYYRLYIAHLGDYRCPRCGRERPTPSVVARQIALDGFDGVHFDLGSDAGTVAVGTALPGLYNVYNALGAAALAISLGVQATVVAAGLGAAAAVFGRGERVRIGDRELAILLIKNPTGANEVLRLLGSHSGPHDVIAILNDEIADGRDVSWIWDADFETLAGRVGRVTCAGTRAAEMALRLKYAGVASERITVHDELEQALDAALAGADGTLYALPTYTAMLALRALLRRRGVAESSWRR